MRKIMTPEEIDKWWRDKKIRVWRRALYLLHESGPLSLYEISDILNADPSGTERQLKKMEIDHWVKRKDHTWHITNTGITKVMNDQKYGSMPTLKWGINY
ncbi:MAG: MarR family transcriptional regulator [Thermoplasmatales archaeon]|nr:MarR family transcriptional regulator [Thermoplasmatales archaeon]